MSFLSFLITSPLLSTLLLYLYRSPSLHTLIFVSSTSLYTLSIYQHEFPALPGTSALQ